VIGVLRLLRWLVRVAILLALVGVGYVGVTFAQVWLASRQDQTRPADVVVVLGAAQYNGQPSPVLKARLDHALSLYRRGTAKAVIVTGGKQTGDRFTEGFSGYQYLKKRGVPEERLFLENQGKNTYEQISSTHFIMNTEGFDSALLVSDPYHSKRLLAIANEVGIKDAHVSPDHTHSSLRALTRETAAVSLGRLVGYRRLGNWI
jgi:vancomycin permeability regulator SanA